MAERAEGVQVRLRRNLDGAYFRVERDGRWENVCYSDMEQRERDRIAEMRAERSTPEEQAAWWRSLADHLADSLYDVGEQLGLMYE